MKAESGTFKKKRYGNKIKNNSYPCNLFTCSLVTHKLRFMFSTHPVRKGAITLSMCLQQSNVFGEKYKFFNTKIR